MRHAADLRQSHSVGHTIDPEEDTEPLAADDLSHHAGHYGQCRNGCHPALPYRVRRRHSGARKPSDLIHGQSMTPDRGVGVDLRPAPSMSAVDVRSLLVRTSSQFGQRRSFRSLRGP